jgi:hypothetical protein
VLRACVRCWTGEVADRGRSRRRARIDPEIACAAARSSSPRHLQALIAFFVEEHNAKMPHSAIAGQTPTRCTSAVVAKNWSGKGPFQSGALRCRHRLVAWRARRRIASASLPSDGNRFASSRWC